MKILIAEDQGMLRDALQQLLLMEDDVETVFAVSNGQEALEIMQKNAVDVAILDIEMPQLTGLEVLEWIRENQDIKVIIVTTFKRVGYFQRAIKANVDAYVLKERSMTELMATIHTVLAGGKEYSPELIEGMVTQPNPLSPQERKILAGVAAGKTSKDISQELFLSPGTVRNYTSSIFNKLGASNRIDAINIAKENDWL